MEERLLLIDEAATRLHRPVSTLRDWRQRGIGPKSARIGRRVMYRERDLAEWIEQQFDRPTNAQGGDAA